MVESVPSAMAGTVSAGAAALNGLSGTVGYQRIQAVDASPALERFPSHPSPHKLQARAEDPSEPRQMLQVGVGGIRLKKGALWGTMDGDPKMVRKPAPRFGVVGSSFTSGDDISTATTPRPPSTTPRPPSTPRRSPRSTQGSGREFSTSPPTSGGRTLVHGSVPLGPPSPQAGVSTLELTLVSPPMTSRRLLANPVRPPNGMYAVAAMSGRGAGADPILSPGAQRAGPPNSPTQRLGGASEFP